MLRREQEDLDRPSPGFQVSRKPSTCSVLKRGKTHFDKCVNGEDDEFGLRFGIVHQIEVHEFLLLQILRLHILQDVRKQARDVLPDSHVGDNTLDRILALVPVLAVQIRAQFPVFACRIVGRELLEIEAYGGGR